MVETLKWAAQTRDVGTKPSAHTTIRTIGKWKEIRLPLGYIAEKAKRPDEYQLERVLCLNRDDEDDVIEDVFVDQREYPPTLFLYIDDHPFPNSVPRECHSNATTVVNNQIFRAVYNADDLSLSPWSNPFLHPLFFYLTPFDDVVAFGSSYTYTRFTADGNNLPSENSPKRPFSLIRFLLVFGHPIGGICFSISMTLDLFSIVSPPPLPLFQPVCVWGEGGLKRSLSRYDFYPCLYRDGQAGQHLWLLFWNGPK